MTTNVVHQSTCVTNPILVGAYTDRIRLLEHMLPILLYLRELAGYDGLCGI